MADYDSQYSPPPRQDGGAQQQEQGNTSIADLEGQLAALKIALEGERKRRNEERDQAATRERVLSTRLKEAEEFGSPKKKAGPVVPRVAGLARARPTTPTKGERTVTATTPRTADNLFVATPSDPGSRTSTPRGRTPTKRWGTSGSKLGTAGQHITPSGLPAEASSSRARVGSPPAPETTTALQVAWNKFCIRARKEFTPPELALVSKETLDNLLQHYGVDDPVEKAQVEGQWALLQEGKQAVTHGATPKVVYKKNRGPLKFPDHPHEFSLDNGPMKPTLSRRTPLRHESPRPGNPNETTSGSMPVRTHSAHRVLTPRKVGVGNPNDTPTYSPHWKSCSGYAPAPAERGTPVRGRAHASAPEGGEFTPRGIKSQGSTMMGGDAVKPSGVRTGNEFHKEPGNNRRGIRTGFTGDHSPVRTHRPSKIVSSPNHIDRSHLSTRTMMNAAAAGTMYQRSSVEAYQRRTPFALDLAPQSANARSLR